MREIVRYRSEHFEGVDVLWKDAFPNDNAWNVAAVAIPEKTRFQPDLMLVVLEDNVIVALSWLDTMGIEVGFLASRS